MNLRSALFIVERFARFYKVFLFSRECCCVCVVYSVNVGCDNVKHTLMFALICEDVVTICF